MVILPGGNVNMYIAISAVLVLTQTIFTSAQYPALLFTCPAWGCSARSTFSLPTPVPISKPHITWNWTEDDVVYGNPDFESRGCTSSLTTVACPTSKGYVTLNVSTGDELLSSKKDNSPYLPIVDYYGNIIESDVEKFVFVTDNGTIGASVNLTTFQPEFGAIISYSNTVLLTSSNTSTPQVLTFGESGSVFASTFLRGKLANITGTFVACGHPVIDIDRAYIVTRFVPNSFADSGAYKLYGFRRLYAIDLTGNSTRNRVTWFFDLPGFSENISGANDEESVKNISTSDYFETYIAFFNNTVYVNYATQPDQEKSSPNTNPDYVPPPPILCGIRDRETDAKLMFYTVSIYGPISLYSITDSWTNINATGDRTVWITEKSSQPVISGFDAISGIFQVALKLDELAKNLGHVTSYVTVTRQAKHPDRDVLVLGTQDDDGQAYLVTIEAGLPPLKPRLLWSLNMSGPRRVPGRASQWLIGGQIAGVAFPTSDKLQFGLAVSVVEGLPWVNASQVYVRLVI